MTNCISKLKWAWRAQFLSRVLVILKISVFFEDKQMILVSFFDIFAGFKFQKNLKSLPIQFLSNPCPGPAELGWQGWQLPPQYFEFFKVSKKNLKIKPKLADWQQYQISA